MEKEVLQSTNELKNETEIYEDYYRFDHNVKLTLKNIPIDLDAECHFGIENWNWMVNGRVVTIRWAAYNFESRLKELLKGYIHFSLQRKSPVSVAKADIDFLRELKSIEELREFPWKLDTLISKIHHFTKADTSLIYSLKSFYKWGFTRLINGFDKHIYLWLKEIKNPKKNSYKAVFLRQNHVDDSGYFKLLAFLKEDDLSHTHKPELFQNKVLLQLAMELAPRPSQTYYLNEDDYEEVPDKNNTDKYCSLSLPMSKKILSNIKEKRIRKVSASLGDRIIHLIAINKNTFEDQNNKALFRNFKKGNCFGERLSHRDISLKICTILQNFGFSNGDGATLLRHHLAQSLADQGASAEVISELLGHNSTVPARAYIASTPKLAEIKTKALGKNETYKDIMQMMLTGKIIEKKEVTKSKWVKGIAGMQYIGDIGACGLSQTTPCPKNPVYACYSCKQFQPFADGSHARVKEGLQKQAQQFIDKAEAHSDFANNRTVIQLESTIEMVDAVIRKIQINNSK